MKSLIPAIFIASGLFLVEQARSQNDPPAQTRPPGQSDPRFNKFSEDLNLTEQQKPKIQAIFQEMQQKIQAAVLQAKTNADAQLQSVLTPEQYQKLETMFQQQQQRLDQHSGHNETNRTQNSQQ
jgi:Spy/CpxP family protein refolding chaperone